MNESCRRGPIVEELLNTLEVERHVRVPLLATIVDELTLAPGLEVAADVARAMFEGLGAGTLTERDFLASLAALRELVRTLRSLAAGPGGGDTRGLRSVGRLAVPLAV
jgi:hypothetical protein